MLRKGQIEFTCKGHLGFSSKNRSFKETYLCHPVSKTWTISNLAPQVWGGFLCIPSTLLIIHKNSPTFSEGHHCLSYLGCLHSQRVSVRFGSGKRPIKEHDTKTLHISKAAHLCTKLSIIIRGNLRRFCSCAHALHTSVLVSIDFKKDLYPWWTQEKRHDHCPSLLLFMPIYKHLL